MNLRISMHTLTIYELIPNFTLLLLSIFLNNNKQSVECELASCFIKKYEKIVAEVIFLYNTTTIAFVEQRHDEQ